MNKWPPYPDPPGDKLPLLRRSWTSIGLRSKTNACHTHFLVAPTVDLWLRKATFIPSVQTDLCLSHIHLAFAYTINTLYSVARHHQHTIRCHTLSGSTGSALIWHSRGRVFESRLVQQVLRFVGSVNIDLTVEQPQLFRKLPHSHTSSTSYLYSSHGSS